MCRLLPLLAAVCTTSAVAPTTCGRGGTVSYNGICTPAQFPPRQNYSRAVPHPSYLSSPPPVINITIGRQLFVDDFLIQNASGVSTKFHTAKYYEHNPVIKPDQPWEGSIAMPFSGGAWWDDDQQRLALWYKCGGTDDAASVGRGAAPPQGQGPMSPSTAGTCLAYSSDGIHFDKPVQDVRPGTNMVREIAFDGNTVWYDRAEKNASRRYKMADVDSANTGGPNWYSHYTLLSSSDGVHWHTEINRTAGAISDCSRVFYNPFRERWVFSIKTNIGLCAPYPRGSACGPPQSSGIGRARGFWESQDLFDSKYTQWKMNGETGDSDTPGTPGYGRWDDPGEIYPWLWADVADELDPETKHPRSPNNEYAQLYTVDAIAYESVMVAFLSILECDNYGEEGPCPGPEYHERNEVFLAFSRDGFSFSRPPAPRLPVAALDESNWTNWNWYDVQSTAGGLIVHEDALHMYVSGRYLPNDNGTKPCHNKGCQVDSTGLAMLRRDGFASLDASVAARGVVFSRRLVWSGDSGGGVAERNLRNALFVNFDGEGLVIELLDGATGSPIEPFTLANSVPFSGDSTRHKMTWKGETAAGIARLVGKPMQIRFEFGGQAGTSSLYSFWVGDAECGASLGYMAGGGPGIGGDVDTRGSCSK